MKRKVRVLLVTLLMMLGLLGIVENVHAAEKGWNKNGEYYTYYNASLKLQTGWKKIDGVYYYFRKAAKGEAPKGSRVTGWYTINSKPYYFNKKGVLQTGWQNIAGKFYYFEPTGKSGTIGTMYKGFRTINGESYYFTEEGTPKTGWVQYKKNKYYMVKSSSIGNHGKAATGWKTIGGARYYFNTKGVMQKSKWIKSTKGYYYVGSDGKRLVSTVTPDGYLVNADGLRLGLASGWVKKDSNYYYYKSGKAMKGWLTVKGEKYYLGKTTGIRQTGIVKIGSYKYYFNADGVMQKGLQKVNGAEYYFRSNGHMVINDTVDGYKCDSKGIVVEKVAKKSKILLIAGHGQGDVGAQGIYSKNTYQEYKLTREFSTLIYEKLKAKDAKNFTVDMYDQNYNCYEIIAKHKTGPNPNFKNYDYVLEIHFNATAESAKDPKGDGNYKGIGMYINSQKKDYSLDAKIVKAAASVGGGFRIWGGGAGIFANGNAKEGLLNARTCANLGVSYGLLETVFIDDKDDIGFYNKNKTAMAEAVAQTLFDHFK